MKRTIINLTQHAATQDQLNLGVVDLEDSRLKELLTFTSAPSKQEVKDRAEAIAQIAKVSGAPSAMIGGAPYLMPALAEALKSEGVTPLFAFTKRVSVDQADGTKVSVFKHEAWVEA